MAGGYSSPRSVGYSLGSAIGGLVLAAGSDTGHVFPNDSAYTTAALVGIVMMAITTMASLVLARKRSKSPSTADSPSAAGSTNQPELHRWLDTPQTLARGRADRRPSRARAGAG